MKRTSDSSMRLLCAQLLNEEAARLNVSVDQRHKKINLRDDTRAWEHERFSMRRLPAFTLSRLESHKFVNLKVRSCVFPSSCFNNKVACIPKSFLWERMVSSDQVPSTIMWYVFRSGPFNNNVVCIPVRSL